MSPDRDLRSTGGTAGPAGDGVSAFGGVEGVGDGEDVEEVLVEAGPGLIALAGCGLAELRLNGTGLEARGVVPLLRLLGARPAGEIASALPRSPTRRR